MGTGGRRVARGAAVAALALLSLLCAPSGPVVGQEKPNVKPRPAVSVTYRDGRVTLEARAATIPAIIRAVARKAGFEADISGDFGDPVALRVTDMPIVALLRRLAGNHSMIMILRSPRDRGDTGPVERVMIRASSGSSGHATAPSGELRYMRRILTESQAEPDLTSPEERIAAIRQVAVTRDSASIGLLERTVARDSDPDVRGHALQALGEIGGQDATLALGRILFGDDNPDNRLAAVKTLSSFRTEVARSFIERAQNDPDHAVKAAASDAIAGWK